MKIAGGFLFQQARFCFLMLCHVHLFIAYAQLKLLHSSATECSEMRCEKWHDDGCVLSIPS